MKRQFQFSELRVGDVEVSKFLRERRVVLAMRSDEQLLLVTDDSGCCCVRWSAVNDHHDIGSEVEVIRDGELIT